MKNLILILLAIAALVLGNSAFVVRENEHAVLLQFGRVVRSDYAPGLHWKLPVLQTVYSDGLTHVSVFIEPYREGRHRAGHTAIGATHTLMKRLDQWWVTVMGDVPMSTVMQFAEALTRRR